MKLVTICTILATTMIITGCKKEELVRCTSEQLPELLHRALTKGVNAQWILSNDPDTYYARFLNSEDRLKKGGFNRKLGHDVNELYLAQTDTIDLKFDNVVTWLIEDDATNVHNCTADVTFSMKDKDGQPVTWKYTEFGYKVYPVDGGDKLGVTYDKDDRANIRRSLSKITAESIGLVNAEIFFTQEELAFLAQSSSADPRYSRWEQ